MYVYYQNNIYLIIHTIISYQAKNSSVDFVTFKIMVPCTLTLLEKVPLNVPKSFPANKSLTVTESVSENPKVVKSTEISA